MGCISSVSALIHLQNAIALRIFFDLFAHYADYTKLRKSIGLSLINAREAPEAIAAFRARGVDIDEGMILLLEGKIYHGAEAIYSLERALHPSWLGRALLRPWLLRIVYPALKGVRRLTLALMGKSGRI